MIYKINDEAVEDLDQSYALEVEMNKTQVHSDKDNTLKSEVVILSTFGVGPCIAFLASGKYRIDGEEYYFAALYHHVCGEQSKITEEMLLKLGRDNLYYFFEGIALEIGEDVGSVLHQFCLIGGQKKDENFSGTEKEVLALESALQQADPFNGILPENMRIHKSLKPECHFFLSHGEAFVDLYVQRDGDASMRINYELFDDNPLFLAAEAQVKFPVSPVKIFFSSLKAVDDSEGKRKASELSGNAPPEKRRMLFK